MSPADKKIVVAGLSCLDITPGFAGEETCEIHTLLQPGRVTGAKGLVISPGGAVSNTGLGLLMLGARPAIMTKIGTDAAGEMLEKLLRSHDAECVILKSDEAGTSFSVVLAVPGNDRLFIHDVGINDFFSYEELDYDAVKDACIFHFGYPQCMRMFYERDGEDLMRMFGKVKDLGTATSLDMAIASPDSPAAEAPWDEILKRTLPCVDIFTPSIEELIFSADRERYEEFTDLAKKKNTDTCGVVPDEYVADLADRMIGWGAGMILVKLGERGMYFRAADRERISEIGGGLPPLLRGWAGKEIRQYCYKPKIIRSASGAGDVSIAAFLCAAQRGYSAEKAVQLAAGAGALCVESYDTLSNILPLGEIEKRIDDGWEMAVPDTYEEET